MDVAVQTTPEAIQQVQAFALQLSERFGQIKTSLYATSAPVDEQLLSERINAIDTLIERLTLALDNAFHATPEHPFSFLQ